MKKSLRMFAVAAIGFSVVSSAHAFGSTAGFALAAVSTAQERAAVSPPAFISMDQLAAEAANIDPDQASIGVVDGGTAIRVMTRGVPVPPPTKQ